jgi:hypothetical protein
MAFLALRFGLAAGAGATGFLAGPVGIITTILSVGWTLYEIYDVLSELDKESESDRTVVEPTATPLPSQSPEGSFPPTGAGAGRGTQGTDAPQVNSNQTSALGNFANPTDNGTFNSGFGMRKDPFTGEMKHHDGFDYSAKTGDPVYAMADGEVTTAENKFSQGVGLGKHIIIKHADGTLTKYGHLSELSVSVGASVKRGQVIGKVGNTGRSKGPHLHVEIHKDGKPIDPTAIKSSESKTSSTTTQSNISGTPAAPPGNKYATLNNMIESTLGFDPSKMGVDMSKELSGESIAKLNAVYKDVSNGSAVVADALNAINNNSQNNKPAVTTPAAPAPTQTSSNTQSKEKDHLWMFYNQSSPYYG